MARVNTVWIQGETDENKARITESLTGQRFLLDKLEQILYNMQRECETVASVDYDSPSWSHKQAHMNGQREMVGRILKLIQKPKDH